MVIFCPLTFLDHILSENSLLYFPKTTQGSNRINYMLLVHFEHFNYTLYRPTSDVELLFSTPTTLLP